MIERIAYIDNDGVLMNYRQEMLRDIARILNKPLDDNFISHFHRSTKHLSDKELLNRLSQPGLDLHNVLNADNAKNFAETATPYPRVIEALELLKEHNFRTYIVTARTDKMRANTEASFVKHGLMKYIDAVFMRYGHKVRPVTFKADMAIALEATHVFEDTFENLEAIRRDSCSLQRAYLINQPWNAKDVDKDELYPTTNVPIERMDSFYHAALDAVST